MQSFCSQQSVGADFPCFPRWTSNMVVAHGGQHSAYKTENQEGLLFPSTQFIQPVIPTCIGEFNIWTQTEKAKSSVQSSKPKAAPLSYEDPDLEAKLFPHLYPYGTGSWRKEYQAITLGAFHKMRLHHADCSWANDCYYFTLHLIVR